MNRTRTLEVDESADADREGAGRRAILGRLILAVFEQAVDLHVRTQRVGRGESDDVAVFAAADIQKDLVIVAARPVDADGPRVQTIGGATPNDCWSASENAVSPQRAKRPPTVKPSKSICA